MGERYKSIHTTTALALSFHLPFPFFAESGKKKWSARKQGRKKIAILCHEGEKAGVEGKNTEPEKKNAIKEKK